MNSKAWVLAAALLASGFAQATCYTVYRADGSFLQEGSTTPVDLTQPLGDTVPGKFGNGATMTMSDLGLYCKDRRGEPVLPKPEAAAKKKTVAAATRKDAAAATRKDAPAASSEEATKKDAPGASGAEAKKTEEPAAKQVAEQAAR